MSVYPNPVTDGEVTVLWGEELDSRVDKIELVDLSGRVLQTHQSPREARATFSVAGLKRGLYVLRVVRAEGTITRKVLVE